MRMWHGLVVGTWDLDGTGRESYGPMARLKPSTFRRIVELLGEQKVQQLEVDATLGGEN